MHLDGNNLYGWAMSQKLPVNGFKWVEKLSKFNERIIESYNENSDIDVEVDIESIRKIYLRIEDKEKYVVHIRSL